jgi:hypothetical protein
MTKDKHSSAFYGIDIHGISYGNEKPAWIIELVSCWHKDKLFGDSRMRKSSCGSLLGVFTTKEFAHLHDELSIDHKFEEGSQAHDSLIKVDQAINTSDTMFVVIHCYLNL